MRGTGRLYCCSVRWFRAWGRWGNSSMRGGEVIGASAVAWNEPAPYGMVLVKRGSVKMGPDKQDSLWGTIVPSREISVESFWMDDTEVTVAEYKQFVNWVRDSIIRERLADPAYGGNELYKIEEDLGGKSYQTLSELVEAHSLEAGDRG